MLTSTVMLRLLIIAFVALTMAPVASAQRAHLNKVVDLLADGKPVFGLFSGPKTPESAMHIATTEADFIFYSMEQGPFDVDGMQVYMQFTMDRKVLRSNRHDDHPLVTRIPPIRDGRIEAQDRTKRILDAGVFGAVFPHVMDAEEAAHAVASMRFRPNGLRPPDVGAAARYWGLDEDDYRTHADLWPLAENGELVSVILIEDQVGIGNAREIASTAGVSVVIPGPGDLRRAYEGNMEAVEEAIQTTLAACKEFDVVCGITAGVDDIEKRLDEGFRFFIVTAPEAIAVGRRASGR